MDAKFGHAVAHRLNVSKKTSFEPLDSRDHNATYRRVRQIVEPSGELRECFDGEHRKTVIDRLQCVKLNYSDRQVAKAAYGPNAFSGCVAHIRYVAGVLDPTATANRSTFPPNRSKNPGSIACPALVSSSPRSTLTRRCMKAA